MDRRIYLFTLLLALAGLTGTEGRAQSAGADPGKKGADSIKKNGTVLTFYGLRKLEEDPAVADEEKLKEWQAFIERATEQIQYAKKAVDRWKNAARLRLVEAARNADRDPKVEPKEKIKKWEEVARLYPRDPEVRSAKKRIAHWTQEETKRIVEAAEEVERARQPKVERIRAWLAVLDWVSEGPEAKAANKRIDNLQQQLFSEAQSVDAIARVDDKTKLAAWQDVLAGRPTPAQERLGTRRVSELEAVVKRESNANAIAQRSAADAGAPAAARGDAGVRSDATPPPRAPPDATTRPDGQVR
jgi:hypothetical protein